ncbi:MAG: LD-carboxypeptidase [Eubacteriales bacterium]|nr:LD-carboxypeptidase [Eubacteriales bacterium]
MRYPEFLKPGGTVYFVAPSFGLADESGREGMERNKRRLESEGYRVVLGPNVFRDDGVGISSKPENCAQELTDAWLSEDPGVLVSVSGGELMCDVIERLDWEKIRAGRPKWYMGFSDNTNMTFLLTTLCDTASVYGPNGGSYGAETLYPSLLDAAAVLKGEKTEVHSYGEWQMIARSIDGGWPKKLGIFPDHKLVLHNYPENDMKFSGRLLGGCIDILNVLLGTEYDRVSEFLEKYKEDGFIWFLESCDLTVLQIRRSLWQMKHAGWFKYAKGFLIGRPMIFGESILGVDQYNAVTDMLGDLDVPIVMDADIGHLPPAMPLITGCFADAEVHGNDLRVKMTLR